MRSCGASHPSRSGFPNPRFGCSTRTLPTSEGALTSATQKFPRKSRAFQRFATFVAAAAEPDADVDAVVSRGGRPDLTARHLSAVTAPTLLIIGGHDDAVLDLNRQAQTQLRCDSPLVVIPGATHLFEEPGTLQADAEAARDSFTRHLAPATPPGLR